MLLIDIEKSDFFRFVPLSDLEKSVLAGTFQGATNELMANCYIQENRPLKNRKKTIVNAKVSARKKLQLEAEPGSGPKSYVPVLKEALHRGLTIEVSKKFVDIVRQMPETTRKILLEMATEGIDGITIAKKYSKSQNWIHDRVEGGAVHTLFNNAGLQHEMPNRVGLVLLNASVEIFDRSNREQKPLNEVPVFPFSNASIISVG